MASALINVPARAKRGEIVEIKTLISHVMETGYRRTQLGAAIPRDIVTRFVCTYNGTEVFRAELHPAIAANPFIAFSTVAVESAMSQADHVKTIHVFNEKNPQPDVASFHLGPRAGRATVSTRIRLADTQTVVAIAELSDGSFWSASAAVVVTLAACLEDA